MAEAEIPLWLKNLPLAPEYRPTETEFADPIAFISRIEHEAASFGICKVIPPLPRPSKKFVLSNLNRSLSKSPELGSTSAAAAAGPSSEYPVFTTRQQELGSRRARPAFPKQVWQSGDLYTLEQFEEKSKAFARSQLGGFSEVTPLLVESLFWKAVAEKPIYIEYANDVPGSGFAVPEEPFRYISWRRNRKRGLSREEENEKERGLNLMTSSDNGLKKKNFGPGIVTDGGKGTSGWKLSNSRWNLQVIARSPGSLTRFMPDDVKGVTSPMVYIGMLFSWFAWHVEDHELHSMNFLHTGSPKTWYAVPKDHAATLEDIVRVKGYGESVDRLAAFTMLGEKTTLLSPEVLVASGIPCCRLVQHPGEFVVTFPRAYHVGFSHGFNCGEAANFATPEWLKVAKEAAMRRAAMNHLPMLSHQQLLYILTMSFVSRVPRTLISGVRSSRLRDRKKEERETIVKKAFLTDMMSENHLLCVLLEKESAYAPILWEPGILPAHCAISQAYPSILQTQYCDDQHGCYDHNQKKKIKTQGEIIPKVDDCCGEKPNDEAIALMSTHHTTFFDTYKDSIYADLVNSDVEALGIVEDEGDLPVGLNIDSGSLACVSCGTLGYPFMAVMQPSLKASNVIFPLACEGSHEKSDKSQYLIASSFCQDTPAQRRSGIVELANLYPASLVSPRSSLTSQYSNEDDMSLPMDNCPLLNCFSMDALENKGEELVVTNAQTERGIDSDVNTFCFKRLHPCDSVKHFEGSWPTKTSHIVENDFNHTSQPFSGGIKETSVNENVGVPKWNVSNILLRPRVFCLQHAIEVEELLQSKGGANMRVICHSDYMKFKAYASSIAEEVGTSLHLKDIPLENASQEDLHLINISIDEEEHQDDGKDWTSKLGVNLRYSVKHRKLSAVAQELLPSALGRMFSSPSTISGVSSLRWLCRKPRTHTKPLRRIVENPHISTNVDGGAKTPLGMDSAKIKAIQVYRSRKKKTNDLAFKDHNHPVEETDSCRQNARGSENADNLITVSVSMIEDHIISQNGMDRKFVGVNTTESSSLQLIAKTSVDHCFSGLDHTNFISVPVMYQYSQLNHNVSASNALEVSNRENSRAECSTDFDGLDLSSQHPLPLTADEDSEELHEKGGGRFSLSAEDQADGLVDDSDTRVEHPVVESILERKVDQIPLNVNCEMRDESFPSEAGDVPFVQYDCSEHVYAVRDERRAGPANIKSYVRRKNKRKRETGETVAVQAVEIHKHVVEAQQSCEGFARSPCEGLRSRNGKIIPTKFEGTGGTSLSRCGKAEGNNSFSCDIEGCLMVFGTRTKLQLHKRNRCTQGECGKRFSSHKYVTRHQRVHNDERPFKCPSKGCGFSFKWEWARTEHLRLHTGERPYRCKVTGCGLSFRFVSDFSRHRRKTGHFVSAKKR